jgi:uncharacterized protein YuzE
MRIQYFPETDTLYVDLVERAATDSWEIGDGIVIDIDDEGHPVGIDIDQASKHLDLESLSLIDIPLQAGSAAG